MHERDPDDEAVSDDRVPGETLREYLERDWRPKFEAHRFYEVDFLRLVEVTAPATPGDRQREVAGYVAALSLMTKGYAVHLQAGEEGARPYYQKGRYALFTQLATDVSTRFHEERENARSSFARPLLTADILPMLRGGWNRGIISPEPWEGIIDPSYGQAAAHFAMALFKATGVSYVREAVYQEATHGLYCLGRVFSRFETTEDALKHLVANKGAVRR